MSETTISGFEVYAVDLPFRVAFKHAAATRRHSDSIFVKCITDTGVTGFGESLPREYVTGESRDGVFTLLCDKILPRLIGRTFVSIQDVEAFLTECDGHAPRDWVDESIPQGAAWCAVDLALLDTIGRATKEQPLTQSRKALPPGFRYSGVLSAEKGLKLTALTLLHRAMGFRSLKMKVAADTSAQTMRHVHRMAGSSVDIRVDANMGWSVEQALERIPEFAELGVSSFEQPLDSLDLSGMARLVKETGQTIMADESFHTHASLDELIERKACTAINARISKCGGLIATLNRCREAAQAGLDIQVGCQVGESSLLSTAHVALCSSIPKIRFAEGCFGQLLLEKDPCENEVRFRRGGRAPEIVEGPGIGAEINESILSKYVTKHASIYESSISQEASS